MADILKYKLSPTSMGSVSCILLIVSRCLLFFQSRGIQVAYFFLVFSTLCLCVHFVRGTAQLFEKHVWEIPSLITLICMPVFNLCAAILPLVQKDSPLLTADAFSLLLVAFSLPAFYCYYFLYLVRRFPVNASFRRVAVLLFVIGGVYLGMRLCDEVVFPFVERTTVWEILPQVHVFVRWNSKLSVAVYMISFVCFQLFGRHLLFEAKKEKRK